MQLNLLYVQARDAILDGTHPVTQEKGMLLCLAIVNYAMKKNAKIASIDCILSLMCNYVYNFSLH